MLVLEQVFCHAPHCKTVRCVEETTALSKRHLNNSVHCIIYLVSFIYLFHNWISENIYHSRFFSSSLGRLSPAANFSFFSEDLILSKTSC